MKRALDLLVTTLLVLAAVSVAAAAVHREFFQPEPPQQLPPLEVVKAWREFGEPSDRLESDSGARILVFTDYQCPFCKALERALDSLRSARPGEVSIHYRHFPIERLHPHAKGAAVAAVCAGRMGKFAPFHRALFANSDSLGGVSLASLAMRVGIRDTTAFVSCLADPSVAQRLKSDSTAARKLRVRGTPTVVVNDVRINGPATFKILDSLVAASRKRP